MIFGIVESNFTLGSAGRLGSGKTLSAVWLALALHFKKDLKIYSNLHLYGVPYTYITHPRDIIGVENAIVVLDDIYRWCNAYKSTHHINGLVNILAGESRKRKLAVVYTSARLIGGIHKGLRDLTNYYILPSYDTTQRLLSITIIDVIGRPVTDRMIHPIVVTKLFDYYDTNEVVPVLT